jgi:hypothetical protein
MSKNTKTKIYRTVILSGFCGCETWSLSLREEHSLRVPENRVLRKIFGSNAGKITGDWKRLHEEPYGLYSPKIMRVINENEMGGACGTDGRQEQCVQGFGGETWGKVTTWKT